MEKSKSLTKNNEINWVCLKDKCPRPCCGSFKEVFKELHSVFGIMRDEIPLTPEDERKIIDKVGSDALYTLEDGKSYLKLTEDRLCRYFQKGWCIIYEVRPSCCQAFPFYIDKFSGLNIMSSCPGIGKGWTKFEDIKDTIDSLVKLYKWQTNEIQKTFLKQ